MKRYLAFSGHSSTQPTGYSMQAETGRFAVTGQPATMTAPRQKVEQIQGDERLLGHYLFEDGDTVRVVASGGVPTLLALETAKTVIDNALTMKRKEIEMLSAKAAKAGAADENSES